MSPWASLFLDPCFKDIIKFKLWNTTEQLDDVLEIKDEWQSFNTLFNSGGHVISVLNKKDTDADNDSATSTTTRKSGDKDDMLNCMGSKSSASYNWLSVILSDMARFILCHCFGGIYLNAETPMQDSAALQALGFDGFFKGARSYYFHNFK